MNLSVVFEKKTVPTKPERHLRETQRVANGLPWQRFQLLRFNDPQPCATDKQDRKPECTFQIMLAIVMQPSSQRLLTPMIYRELKRPSCVCDVACGPTRPVLTCVGFIVRCNFIRLRLSAVV